MSEPVVRSAQRQRISDPPAKLEQVLGFPPGAVTAGRPPLSLRRAAAGGLLALLAALALVGQAQAKSLSKADREFVDSTVETAMKEEGQPGVMISISGPVGDYTRAYGVADLATHEPMSLEDHFRIGSITKTITATAILRQVEAGHLKLSDNLNKWIKGIPYGNKITIRDMLDMQSGIYEYEADAALQREFTENPKMKFGPRDVVRIIREHNEAYFPPGEHTMYVNSNYVLLGLILEQVSGESAEAAVTRVIQLLGLHQTSFPTTPSLPAPFALGYCLNEQEAKGPLQDCTEFNPNIFWTDGAVISTIGDLRKYATELGTGVLLSPEMQKQRLTFHNLPYSFEGPKEFGYGLGILKFGTWLGHDGSVPGFGTETMYEPKTGAVIAGMENLQTPPLAIFSRIYERIAAHLYPRSLEEQ